MLQGQLFVTLLSSVMAAAEAEQNEEEDAAAEAAMAALKAQEAVKVNYQSLCIDFLKDPGVLNLL